jgi:hypothetical protein
MIDIETFRVLDSLRKYSMLNGDRTIFTFVKTSLGLTIIDGTMKGYSIVFDDIRRFYGEQYSVKDCGEAPISASVSVGKVPGRPHTPE